MELEKEVLEIILSKSKATKEFAEMVANFEKKFEDFNPAENCFDIKDYFSEGCGKVAAKNKLITDRKIESNWCDSPNNENENKDFKGIYVFVHDKTPFYVGISKGVIGRIIQHTKGKSHNSASLAYKIGVMSYDNRNVQPFTDERKNLPFATYVEPIQKFLLKQKIAFLKIDDNEELYLFEVFCSMKLKTYLNDFETH